MSKKRSHGGKLHAAVAGFRQTFSQDEILKVPARFMKPRVALLASVLVLFVLGLISVYTATSVRMIGTDAASGHLALKQAIFGLGAFLLAYGMSCIDYHRFFNGKRLALIALVLFALLFYTRFFTRSVNGANRWVDLKVFQLQPTELVKPYIVVAGAYVMTKLNQGGYKSVMSLVVSGVYLGLVPLGLVLIQPDKGSTAIMVVTLLFMALAAGILSMKSLGIITGVIVLGGLGLSLATPYSRDRILALMDPEKYRFSLAYQIMQGTYGFANGGLLGVGFGMSKQKYAYLPEAQTDFILAILGEEAGFVGLMVVFYCFYKVLTSSLTIARSANDEQGKLIAVGAGSMIVTQFMLNALGVASILPLSGKPVPFLSYGGSSLLSSFLLIGLVWNVSRHSTFPENVHDQARKRLSIVQGGAQGASINAASRRQGGVSPDSLAESSRSLVEGMKSRLAPARSRSREDSKRSRSTRRQDRRPEARGQRPERPGDARNQRSQRSFGSQGQGFEPRGSRRPPRDHR